MAQIKKLLAQIENNPQNVRFNDLVKVCDYYVGEPRQKERAIMFTELLGREILELISKTKKERRNHTR